MTTDIKALRDACNSLGDPIYSASYGDWCTKAKTIANKVPALLDELEALREVVRLVRAQMAWAPGSYGHEFRQGEKGLAAALHKLDGGDRDED